MLLRTSHPAPAASPTQTRLESRALEQLGTSPSLCAHPFGIASLTSANASLTLHLDAYIGHERYSFPEHCLSRLLPATPAPGSGDDVPGIPGLRVSGIEAGGRQLHLHMVKDPGQEATLVLVLPRGLAEGWADVEHRHRHWCEDNGLRPLWTTPHLDPVESNYLNAYASLERSRARRAAVGSALPHRHRLLPCPVLGRRRQLEDRRPHRPPSGPLARPAPAAAVPPAMGPARAGVPPVLPLR